MVKVRLARQGTKKLPFYHIVVTDSEYPRDSNYIEQIGTYNPRKPMTEISLKNDRLAYWLSVGARPSETLAKVLREYKKAQPAVAAN